MVELEKKTIGIIDWESAGWVPEEGVRMGSVEGGNTRDRAPQHARQRQQP